jgi:hypothetical protein
VESSQRGFTLHVSTDMWFYLAITAPLMIATLLGWYCWELRVWLRSSEGGGVDLEMGSEHEKV